MYGVRITYHNILKLFIGISKFERTSLLCTRFHVQCCQSVIRNMVFIFMCRLDRSVNYILNDILTSTLRFTSRIRKHWNKLLYKMTFGSVVRLCDNLSTRYTLRRAHQD